MRILFYNTASYDQKSFDRTIEEDPQRYGGIEINYLETDLAPNTAALSKGYTAVCAFVNSELTRETLRILAENGVRLLLMRCAGYNNVDMQAAGDYGITVKTVPGYSPEAVAEFAMMLALAVNRRVHKAYIKVRENNFSLAGLTGINFYQKTAGIIGTGKIGAAMCRLCSGFGMEVLAYDKRPNTQLDFVRYVTLEELLQKSDLISLHCPLTEETYHIINENTIARMKKGVIFVNTSRGALVDTNDLIKEIRAGRFFGVGLDVYEEEGENVFENREEDLLEHSVTARLLSFPNVIVTSHQGFLTREALSSISRTTLENALEFEKTIAG